MTISSGWRIKAGILICLLLGAMKFGIMPLFQWRDDAMERIPVLQRMVAKKSDLAQSGASVDSRLSTARERHEDLLNNFYASFSDPQELQLILQKRIEALAAQTGITVASADWSYPASEGVVSAPIHVKVDGVPGNVLKFVEQVENNPQFLTIDGMKLVSNGKRPTISVEFDITAYGIASESGNELAP